MGVGSNLNENEKLVLRYLVDYPNLQIKQIAQKANLKSSTVQKIVERLEKRDYIKKLIRPNFRLLGYKLKMIIFFRLHRNFIDVKTVEEIKKKIYNLYRGFIWVETTPTDDLIIYGYFKDQEHWAEIKKEIVMKVGNFYRSIATFSFPEWEPFSYRSL